MKISVSKGDFPILFGGFGFHNSEALFYPIIEKEQFNQKICKCYREISPGFMRTFAGYANWSKESMDAFAEYYDKMQCVTDTPMYFACAKGQLHFSDEERMEYAEKVAENLDYLINEKGVKQLRYYCYSNEMSINDWGGLLKDLPLFQKYHEYLYRAFQKRNLNIGLLATDASDGYWDTIDYAIENMNRISEDFCLHTYIPYFTTGDTALYPWLFEECRKYVMKAIRCDGKRLILGELGVRRMLKDENGELIPDDFVHLPGVIKDVSAFTYANEEEIAALMYAEAVLAAINAGVFAIAMWTFTDYPDPYVCHYAEHDEYAKKWGQCERFISQTQDVKYNKCGLIKWEDDADYSVKARYYCLGLISRYCRRNSKVLDIENTDPLLRICGLMNKDGTVSIVIINRNDSVADVDIDLNLKYIESFPEFRVYEYDSANPPVNEFGDLQGHVDSVKAVNGKISYKIKPQFMIVLSTDYKERQEIFAEGVSLDGNILSWATVEDDLHCYYRVYRGTTPDFVPSIENQIASTVAEELDFSERYLPQAAINNVRGDYFKVISVNKKR